MLCLYPSGSWLGAILRLLGVGVVTRYVYGRLCSGGRAGEYVLLAAWTLLGIGYALNCHYFTIYSGGTTLEPVLLNDDASVAWAQLVGGAWGLDNHCAHLRLVGFASFLRLLVGGGVTDVGDLLAFSMLAVLLTIVLAGATAWRLVGGNDRRIEPVAMALIVSGSYFLASGVLILKDAYMCLLMSVWVFGLVVLARGRRVTAAMVLMALCIPVAVLVRPHLLPFAAVGAVCMSPVTPRRRLWCLGVLAAVCFATYFLLRDGAASMVFNNDGTTAMDIDTTPGRLTAYEAVAGSYAELPLWQRLVRLPFAFAVQWLTPLPWAFGRDIIFGPSQAWAHFALPWYAIGGVLLYFLFFELRRAPRALAAAFVFGVVAWVITAFVTGGTVSRYCLPWLPALIPAAAWVVVTGRYRERRFKRFFAAYAALIVIAVATALFFLNRYGMWEAVG